jgi:Arm DNA-binding domain
MPKIIEPLTVETVDAALPNSKPVRLYDGEGLYMFISPTGGKLWRFKYRFEGKEKLLSFGSYPDVSLDSARLMRSDARQLLKAGINPLEARKRGDSIDKAARNLSERKASVRVDMDGGFEIWKGRVSILLSNDEARFIKDQLCKLVV